MRHPVHILFIIMLFAVTGTYAQPAPAADDELYGPDPLLHNGKFYTYYIPSSTKGTPYFNGPEFVKGSVTLRGVTYTDLPLKYDVINQQLILQYKTKDGGIKKLIISEAWLEAFNVGGAHFELITTQDSIKQIYQVIGNGPYQLGYSWWKTLKLDSKPGSHSYVFTDAEKKQFVLTENTIQSFKNNKTFVSVFPASIQSLLKKHLQRSQIHVKNASEQVMTELINFCNTKVVS